KSKVRTTTDFAMNVGRSHNTNTCFMPFLSVNQWLVWKSVVFALLGLLALDGGLSVTSVLAQTATRFSISPSTLAFTATVGSPNKPGITQTIQPGQAGTFTLTASFANLTAGSYSGAATISGGGITQQVPVT